MQKYLNRRSNIEKYALSGILLAFFLTFFPWHFSNRTKIYPELTTKRQPGLATDFPQPSSPIELTPTPASTSMPTSVSTSTPLVSSKPSPSVLTTQSQGMPSPTTEQCQHNCESEYQKKKSTTCVALLSAGGSGGYAACLGRIGKEKQECLSKC